MKLIEIEEQLYLNYARHVTNSVSEMSRLN